jgi:hypothetical protein
MINAFENPADFHQLINTNEASLPRDEDGIPALTLTEEEDARWAQCVCTQHQPLRHTLENREHQRQSVKPLSRIKKKRKLKGGNQQAGNEKKHDNAFTKIQEIYYSYLQTEGKPPGRNLLARLANSGKLTVSKFLKDLLDHTCDPLFGISPKDKSN